MEYGKNKELINQLKDFFKTKENVELAFLFGSEAKGRAIRESDVDLAVWLKEPYNDNQAEELWQEIERLIEKSVDLIILNQARPTVAWAAMRGRKLLIRNYYLYLNKLLEISTEAEDIQDFVLDLFNLREKLRKQGANL